jgi:hypothetical protein
MLEVTMTKGAEVLARIIGRIAPEQENPEQLAAELWPEFRSAVAAAQLELEEGLAEGLRRWQGARHP